MDNDREEIYSKAVRRTYFSTWKQLVTMIITWQSQKVRRDLITTGIKISKHKIFLYKEDFEKFAEGLDESLLISKPPSAKLKAAYTDPQKEEFDVDFDQI